MNRRCGFHWRPRWRRSPNRHEATRIYDLLLHQVPPEDPWWRCAAVENEIAQGREIKSKAVWRCVSATVRPHLDARLDDEVWQHAERIALKSPRGDDADWPAGAMIAHDREFLYLAVSCRPATGCEYPVSRDPRPRDADLQDRDRIELLIDENRDWNTFSRLVVDSRGWTRDSRLECTSWNPTWYVAADQDAHQWTIEAAIPLVEPDGLRAPARFSSGGGDPAGRPRRGDSSPGAGRRRPRFGPRGSASWSSTDGVSGMIPLACSTDEPARNDSWYVMILGARSHWKCGSGGRWDNRRFGCYDITRRSAFLGPTEGKRSRGLCHWHGRSRIRTELRTAGDHRDLLARARRPLDV